MGCISIREKVSNTEEAIMRMESHMEFFKNNCIVVDAVIRKYSYKGLINEAQMKDIARSLELKINDSFMSPSVETLYEKLRNVDHYKLKDILILGIILSNGVSRQRARLVFEAYDIYCTEFLSKIQLKEFLGDLEYISIILLPDLVDNSTNPPASESEITVYIHQLQKKLIIAEKKLLELIIGEEKAVGKSCFINFFECEAYAKILTPHGFRCYVNNIV
jgi:hypothetical protein